jgi:uncharacterized membrane protein YoaT (DUF817 family)
MCFSLNRELTSIHFFHLSQVSIHLFKSFRKKWSWRDVGLPATGVFL